MKLLDEINRAESDGEKRVAKAKQDSDALISSAREEARELFERAKGECQRAESKMITDAEATAHERIRKTALKNKEEIKSLRASAEKNIEQAIRLIIDSVAGTPEWR